MDILYWHHCWNTEACAQHWPVVETFHLQVHDIFCLIFTEIQMCFSLTCLDHVDPLKYIFVGVDRNEYDNGYNTSRET